MKKDELYEAVFFVNVHENEGRPQHDFEFVYKWLPLAYYHGILKSDSKQTFVWFLSIITWIFYLNSICRLIDPFEFSLT